MSEQLKTRSGALSEVFGDEGKLIIDAIHTPLEDKDISAKLEVETSRVRTILNELLEKNLVHLHRDRLDTGYTHYHWVRREDKILDYVNQEMEDRIEALEKKLERQQDIVFECECKTLDYAEAIEEEFSCIDCGKKLSPATGKGTRAMKAELKRLMNIANSC